MYIMLFFYYYLQLKKENELLRSNLMKILENKSVMDLDEYELYLSLQQLRPLKKKKKWYPKLPESEEE